MTWPVTQDQLAQARVVGFTSLKGLMTARAYGKKPCTHRAVRRICAGGGNCGYTPFGVLTSTARSQRMIKRNGCARPQISGLAGDG
ncbi:hypothetical protein C4K04_5297 [Pseudomonas chlororaphis]|uniref:Uncharacterized protein n=1 Tax=Pseudomonas chlororaphis TaxID=587753 RepID=A0A3G7TXK6_9PSED|nr:hypothetical protein C4K04_5297 [Pseudomonas chlororaphis]